MLERLPEVITNFLKTQWHEDLSPNQLKIIIDYIQKYLELNSLPEIEDVKNMPKHPPKLKIRGLLFRDREEKSQNSKKPKKMKRSKEENLAILAAKQQVNNKPPVNTTVIVRRLSVFLKN